MKLYEYWLGLHPLDWEFCFMPVQTYKNFITEQYYKKRPCIRLIQDACSIIEKEFFGGKENEQSADDGTDNR